MSLKKLKNVKQVLLVVGASKKELVKHSANIGKINFAASRAMSDDFEVSVLHSKKGKPIQLNFGILNAKHDWVWCIHGDSKIKKVDEHFFKSLNSSEIYYGALRFFGRPHILMKLNEIGVYFRCKFWGMPFGDQSILMSQVAISKLGMFDESIKLGETHEYFWRAKYNQIPVKKGKMVIATSSRKYKTHGWAKVTFFHLSESIKQMKMFRKKSRGIGEE
jgi:hypothetical protein